MRFGDECLLILMGVLLCAVLILGVAALGVFLAIASTNV